MLRQRERHQLVAALRMNVPGLRSCPAVPVRRVSMGCLLPARSSLALVARRVATSLVITRGTPPRSGVAVQPAGADGWNS
jgi:hypothetical protein